MRRLLFIVALIVTNSACNVAVTMAVVTARAPTKEDDVTKAMRNTISAVIDVQRAHRVRSRRVRAGGRLPLRDRNVL